MDQATFAKEIAKCQELSKKNKGKCAWGECDKCGAVPLLYKLGEGKIYEEKEEVKAPKEKVLNINSPS